MRERERQGGFAIKLAQLRDLVLVDQYVVGAHEPATEAAPCLHGPLIQRGGHLPQIACRLGAHAVRIASELVGQRTQPLVIPSGIQQLGNLSRVGR